jgi:hypothetical protein
MALIKGAPDRKTVFVFFPKKLANGQWSGWFTNLSRVKRGVFTPMFDYLGEETEWFEV